MVKKRSKRVHEESIWRNAGGGQYHLQLGGDMVLKLSDKTPLGDNRLQVAFYQEGIKSTQFSDFRMPAGKMQFTGTAGFSVRRET
jgi:hypothetical protein